MVAHGGVLSNISGLRCAGERFVTLSVPAVTSLFFRISDENGLFGFFPFVRSNIFSDTDFVRVVFLLFFGCSFGRLGNRVVKTTLIARKYVF